jgi:hypothetical protein
VSTAQSVGFLHTAEAHKATFTTLLVAENPEVGSIHVVDPSLLDRARVVGLEDSSLIQSIDSHLRRLAKTAGYIVCTCSTIGGLAEARGAALGTDLGIRVVRIDRPMATCAVLSGGSIAVVASVESTFAPTVDLLHNVATVEGCTIKVTLEPCLQAWAFWEAGDVDGYHRCVAKHVVGLDPSYDVVVLAQGSMLGALQYLASSSRVVLASPQLGVAEAVRAVTSKT